MAGAQAEEGTNTRTPSTTEPTTRDVVCCTSFLLDGSSKASLRRKRLRSGEEGRELGRHPLLTAS